MSDPETNGMEELARRIERIVSLAGGMDDVGLPFLEELRALPRQVQDMLGALQRERVELLEHTTALERALGKARRRVAELTPLVVTSERPHGTLDRGRVLLALQEIVASLLGCEEMAVFEIVGTPPALSVATSHGLPGHALGPVPPGAAIIARTVSSGEAWVAGPGKADPWGDPPLTACIPLKVDGRVTGAIALYRLLEHKAALEPGDLHLLELLGTHAATALRASRKPNLDRAG